jgi:hypothetical protein
MSDKYKISRKRWNESNPEVLKEANAKYNAKNPSWGFRPSTELREWLEEERWEDDNGNPETNSALVTRKLKKLMKLEQEGY